MTTLLDQAKAIIAGRMGNREDLLENIEDELQNAITNILERDSSLRPWYLLTEAPVTTVSTVANQGYVALPTDFLAEYEWGFVRLTDAQGTKRFLKKADYEYNAHFKGTDSEGIAITGAPTHYTLLKGRMQLFPVPDAVYGLEFMYYKATSLLKNSQDTNEHLLYANQWLVGQAGRNVALFNQHADASTAFAEQGKIGRYMVMGETEERNLRNAWTGGSAH
jgi:hypothetical protein